MKCTYCQNELYEEDRFCNQCGSPVENKSRCGFGIGDIGLLKVETIHIGGSLNEQTEHNGAYCAICGLWVETKNSFRCKKCGRSHLCSMHLDSTQRVCEDCVVLDLPSLSQIQKMIAIEQQSAISNQLLENSNTMKLTLAQGVEMEFVRVPAGEFLMGSTDNDEAADANEKPQHKVYLDEYWIGKYPVINREYQIYVNITTVQPPQNWDGNQPPEGMEYHPVVFISWKDARDFCLWLTDASGRQVNLPTEAEWEKAARGTRGRIYPWGNQSPDEKRCNILRMIGNTTPVGNYSPASDSPYGCTDMAGNVWEWVQDWFDEQYYLNSSDSNPVGPNSACQKVLRGGSWEDRRKLCRSANRLMLTPSYGTKITGFRCTISAEH